MANGLFESAREGFLNGDISWSSGVIKAQLVDTANYTVDMSGHTILDDVPAPARIGAAVTLTGKDSTAGIADAENPTFTSVTGPTTEALVIYLDTGSGTSPLIAYIDDADGLPAAPNGTNIEIIWDNGPYKIFQL
jgi:hypothetical protein